MKLLGKILNLIGIVGCILAVVYQVYLNYNEFGKWYSGYIIIHWSLSGLLGIFLILIGYKLIEKTNNKKNKDDK